MKTFLQFSAFAFIISMIFTSCSSNKVVQESLIQKRKYRDGFFISLNQKNNNTKSSISKILSNENSHSKSKIKKTEIKSVSKKVNFSSIGEIVSIKDSKSTGMLSEQKVISHKIRDKTVKFDRAAFFRNSKRSITKIDAKIDNEPGLSALALAGFICSIVGFLLLITVGFPFFLAVVGTVLSAIGMKQTSEGKTGKGFAIAGLVLGILTFVVFWGIILFIGFLLF